MCSCQQGDYNGYELQDPNNLPDQWTSRKDFRDPSYQDARTERMAMAYDTYNSMTTAKTGDDPCGGMGVYNPTTNTCENTSQGGTGLGTWLGNIWGWFSSGVQSSQQGQTQQPQSQYSLGGYGAVIGVFIIVILLIIVVAILKKK